MDQRTLVFGIFGIVVVGAGAILVNSFAVESTKNELRMASAQLAEAHNTLTAATESIGSNESRMRDLHIRMSEAGGGRESLSEMLEAIEKLKKKIEKAKVKWSTEVGIMESFIQQSRDALKKTPLPEIRLAVGPPLKDCTIIGFTDNRLGVMHSSGTARLTAAQLPADLVDRLRIGWSGTLEIPEEESAGTKIDNGKRQPKSPEPLPESSADEQSSTPARKKPNEQLMSQMRAKIESLKLRIQAGEREKAKLDVSAQEADEKYRSALAKGRISSQNVVRDKARESSIATQNQIDIANSQLTQLERELSQNSNQ